METAPPVSFPLEGITLPGPAVTAECIISLSKSSAEVKVVLQPEEIPKPSNEASHSTPIPTRQDSKRTPGTSRGTIRDQSTNQLDPPCITESHMFVGLEPMDHQDVQVCEVSVQSEHCKDLKEHSLLSIQRSHSDSYQDCKEVTGSHLCETGVLNRHLKVQDVQSFPSLVCKQAMPLQQSNTVTTSTRAGSTSPGSPTQLAKHVHVQICQCGQAGCRIAESERPIVEEVVCGNSHMLCGSVEDTCAAYCHPQPIPAPAQLLPQSCWTQASPRHMLALPRLISSVSETGLDGQRLLHCCNQDCSWPGPLRSSGQWVGGKSTKEAGTMTLQIKMRDKAIQVDEEPEERPKHVFPEVCLMEANTRSKSPIREVKWDAEGMTWDVYGASVDPEELGFAIQKHLEIQIKETKGIASKLSRQNTTTSQQSGSSWRRKKSLFGSLRHPGCCSRSTTAVD